MEAVGRKMIAFPVPLTSPDVVTNIISSIINILTAPRKLVQNERYKLNTLHLLRYLIRSPRCKLPSEICCSDFTEVIVADILKKKITLDPLRAGDVLHMTGAAIAASFDSSLKNDLIKSIIQNMSPGVTDDIHNFLHYAWQIRDSVPLHFDTLEEICLVVPTCLEGTLLDLVQEAVLLAENEDFSTILQAFDIQSYISLCSKSLKIFQKSMTILYQLLLISNVNPKVLYLLREFTNMIKKQCQEISFFELFPSDLHKIIIALKIDPELYPDKFTDTFFTRASVLNVIVENLKRKRRATSALLLLYPKWLPIVRSYCVKNNITEIVPVNRSLSDEVFQYHMLLS